jgi:hypothetical protein
VQVYDKDLRTEQLLGEAITNTDGYYEVTYTADQFRRAEKRTGDLTFRVFSQEGIAVEVSDVIVGEASLPEPKVLFNAPAEVWANLVVVPPAPLSEYERLLIALRPVLEDVQLAELAANDIMFLVRRDRHRTQTARMVTRCRGACTRHGCCRRSVLWMGATLIACGVGTTARRKRA